MTIRRLALALLAAASAHAAASDSERGALPPGYAMDPSAASASGGFVIASAQAFAKAPCAQAWETFTDFEAMPSFLPGLESSRVLSRSEGKATLAQAGSAALGPFARRYSSTREVSFFERSRVESRSVAGDPAELLSSTTFADRAGGCAIAYQAKAKIPAWAPAFAAIAAAKALGDRQMRAMLAEIARRAASAGVASGQPAP